MSSRNSDRVRAELESIRKKHRGLLRPMDVVEFAADASTALHSSFNWDDTTAAHQFRLIQARQLIVRVVVEMEDVEDVQAYVSLSPDRQEEGGGYRGMDDILGNRTWYEQMLVDALAELDRVKEKYGRINELRPTFAEVEKVRARRKEARKHVSV